MKATAAAAAIAAVLLAAPAGSAWAQADKPGAWNVVASKIKDGCMAAQAKTEAGRLLRAGVIDRTCTCLAQKTTKRMLDSPEYMRALRIQDENGMTEAIQALQREPDGTHLLEQCHAQTLGEEATAGDSLPAEASKAVSLRGKTRDMFVRESSASCRLQFGSEVASGRLTKQALEGFCGCMANGVADQVSEADLKQGAASNGRTPALDKAAQGMQRQCSQQIAGG